MWTRAAMGYEALWERKWEAFSKNLDMLGEGSWIQLGQTWIREQKKSIYYILREEFGWGQIRIHSVLSFKELPDK